MLRILFAVLYGSPPHDYWIPVMYQMHFRRAELRTLSVRSALRTGDSRDMA
jgi:hypothetical protein